ncbi:unnamed protein product [Meloidogyne enterolobii]|uniref:Uncharacterized protein n=1 Tax=Meloidogyne enterolobii TaxID=390850 RepID=A0ACB0YHY5_MELEN
MPASLTKVLVLILLNICAVLTKNDPIVFNYLALPATIDLVKAGFGKGFYMKDIIVFNGTILKEPDQFTINLFEDGVMLKNASVQFHFNACFKSKLVIISYSF